MPRLVDYAKQRFHKIAFVVAGSNAHIRWHTATKWVCTYIQAAVIKIKAKQLHCRQPQFFLLRDGKWPLRDDNFLLCL